MTDRLLNYIGLHHPGRCPTLDSGPGALLTLFRLLETEPLHPMFHDALPQHAPAREHPDGEYAKARAGMTRYLGNFWAVSCCFNIDTREPDLIATLDGLIERNRASEAYRAAAAEWAAEERRWHGTEAFERARTTGHYPVETDAPAVGAARD